MEQDELGIVLDPSEVITEQGGEAPAAAVLAGEVAGAEEGVSEVDGSVRVAASQDAEKQDLQELSSELGEEVAAVLGDAQSEVRGAHPEFRAAAAGVPVLGASTSYAPAPVTGTQEELPPMADGDHGAVPGDDDKKLNKRACSARGATVAIAHASPPDSYRRAPAQSRKQHSPKRFVAAPGSAGTFLTSSGRPPSRGRKQPHPEHFIPEKDRARARTKVRRRDIALDSFLTSLVLGSSASESEWARNVTEGNTASGASGSGPRSAASEPHAAALSPPRRRRRRGVLEARRTEEGDSTATSALRLRPMWSLFRP